MQKKKGRVKRADDVVGQSEGLQGPTDRDRAMAKSKNNRAAAAT